MGLEIPIPVSMKLGDNNNLFRRIVEAAQRPHLSIPETELGKSTKQHRHLIQRSVGYAVGMFPFPVLILGIVLSLCMMSSSIVREATVQSVPFAIFVNGSWVPSHVALNAIPMKKSANSLQCFAVGS